MERKSEMNQEAMDAAAEALDVLNCEQQAKDSTDKMREWYYVGHGHYPTQRECDAYYLGFRTGWGACNVKHEEAQTKPTA